ncbi:peroxiredoxin-4 [Caerostris extrusa]|uniref:thioredoxin-dependent peroxiredoxin n=1 Tax=Caerostris extrusa TaxID=172846 RepID=A0AAV4XRS1_CAEEX|nr:peroxiredoxin-4 [Caerostris extrusa]
MFTVGNAPANCQFSSSYCIRRSLLFLWWGTCLSSRNIKNKCWAELGDQQSSDFKPAPDWEGTAVVKGEFKELKLKDFKGKYLVFFFYPLDFDRVKEFHAINTEVIACSVDSPFTHLAWMNTPRKLGGLGPINIPLLSDLTHQISKDYGVYLEDLGHTLRGLFIVDDKGILRQITMNDLPVGRSVDETLRLVQAFQYTDQHGEVCPAGWKPGGDTIIPNPEDKLKYFSKFNQ